jgi:lipoate synthase
MSELAQNEGFENVAENALVRSSNHSPGDGVSALN